MVHAQEQQLHALGAHILAAGFSESRWSDVLLLVNSVSGWHARFHLHGIVLSRVPFFARRLPESRQLILELVVHDPAITQDALHICLAHIYGAAAPERLAAPAARALLATASLFELDELADWALGQVKATFAADEHLVTTTRFVTASIAANTASVSSSSASASSQQQQQQHAGAHLLVDDHWARLSQAAGAGPFYSAPAPPGGSNGGSAFASASEDISSASSPNTFDPTAASESVRNGDNHQPSFFPPPSGLHISNGRNGHAAPPGGSHAGQPQHHAIPFPDAYAARIAALQQGLFLYLTVSLPIELGAFAKSAAASSAGAPADRLLQIYAELDFELFREIMQNPQLPVAGVQERFAFAKRCIAVRNKNHAAQLRAVQQQQQQQNGGSPRAHAPPPPPPPEQSAEEQVVLAFGGSLGGGGPAGGGVFFGGGGGGDGMGGTVQIFRKPVRQRRYAKASAALG